jgi:hypothetical protein
MTETIVPAPPAAATPPPKEEEKTVAKRAIEVLGLLGAAAGLFYALGLLFLATQIWLTYQLSFEATWYAATLVSKAVVLGQGLRVLIVNAVNPVTLVSAAMVLLASAGAPWLTKVSKEHESWFNIALLTICVPLSVFCIAILYLRFTSQIPAAHAENPAVIVPGFKYLPFVLRLSETFALLFAMHIGVRKTERKRSRLGTMMTVFVLLLAYGTIQAVRLGTLAEPPLAPVKTVSSQGVVQGRLLGHSDGYWHVIQKDGTIVSLANDEAKIVTTDYGKTSSTKKAAP